MDAAARFGDTGMLELILLTLEERQFETGPVVPLKVFRSIRRIASDSRHAGARATLDYLRHPGTGPLHRALHEFPRARSALAVVTRDVAALGALCSAPLCALQAATGLSADVWIAYILPHLASPADAAFGFVAPLSRRCTARPRMSDIELALAALSTRTGQLQLWTPPPWLRAASKTKRASALSFRLLFVAKAVFHLIGCDPATLPWYLRTTAPVQLCPDAPASSAGMCTIS